MTVEQVTVNKAELYGLAEDTKPTANISIGSTFTEIDTSKVFVFSNGDWNLLQVLPRT